MAAGAALAKAAGPVGEAVADVVEGVGAPVRDDHVGLLFAGGEPNPRSEWLFFLYFHDCYHTGQTELLRQAAGMNDKVI